ncbi:anthranilate synthase component I family protein [Cellulophaga baltica]|uniref:anthranilate synthase component I family protein n=1 Tax=Cellulophaga TaxID=104264 RepID=UPI001C06E030|nr:MULTISPECIES: anthranilate synthase component I family protein [Cellulophaga]MBU2997534.1 anthranilate synthase component I family protein [Cellulophaga baltica]MDO6768929.1 anthranilate synthase component I family protein [Cellulophaga sp. 1_MG-2023]
MRKKVSYKIVDITTIKASILQWAQQYYEVVWLDNNSHKNKYSSFDGLLATDALTSLKTDYINAFEDLKTYQKETNDWLFGYLSYDLKNDIEQLSSSNYDGVAFPDLYFFQPKKIIKIIANELEFDYLNMVDDEIEEDYQAILAGDHNFSTPTPTAQDDIHIKMRIFKDEYYRQVTKMLAKIKHGAIYEANFCQEFYAENFVINPEKTFQKLNKISTAPFTSFLKLNDKYLLSASPERYLRKEASKLISQPIKGTAKRSSNLIEDEQLKTNLENDDKERAENIMIVDLVRNDLSKKALKSSVVVEELCKVYTFDQVHQMISTITAHVASNENPIDIIKSTFPMGSMTGAPKVSAMKIIEELEAFKRGLYSGAVGYITPDGDFDFNVVIRSILYNDSKPYISFSVGSAITSQATPEREYQECLLKAKAMRQVLEN